MSGIKKGGGIYSCSRKGQNVENKKEMFLVTCPVNFMSYRGDLGTYRGNLHISPRQLSILQWRLSNLPRQV